MPIPSRLTIELDPAISNRLTILADRNGKDPTELAAAAVVDLVEQDASLVAEITDALRENGPFSDRDYARLLLGRLDLEAQLIAIGGLLSRNQQAEQDLRQDILNLEAQAQRTTSRSGYISEMRDVHVHHSIYQDAVHSMAAVGTLAPLIEALFVNAFHGIRENFFKFAAAPFDHTRAEQSLEELWDCHFAFKGQRTRKDLVAGVQQLADATGLTPFLPRNYIATMEALFAYRNNMFHWGFEWPPEERMSFKRKLDKGTWPRGWFTHSMTNDQPWIFYMSQVFIDHCTAQVERIIDGLGKYARNMMGHDADVPVIAGAR